MADDPLVRAVLDGLAGHDPYRTIEALRGRTEAERRAVWRALPAGEARAPAAILAVLGCAPGAVAAIRRTWLADADEELSWLMVEVLAERRPAWLEAFVSAVIAVRGGTEGWGFRVVRGLVRRGVVPEPDDPRYVEAMVDGLAGWRPDRQARPVIDALRAEPDLLATTVWRMLVTERAGRALDRHDQWLRAPRAPVRGPAPTPRPEATWGWALTVLAAEGALDRGRLLDVVLGVMVADRDAVDVRWFVRLHEDLAPTDAELAARVGLCLRLPASVHGPVVAVGLRAVRRLAAAGAGSPAALAAAVAPPLLGMRKGVALDALRVLEAMLDGSGSGSGSGSGPRSGSRSGSTDEPAGWSRDAVREAVAEGARRGLEADLPDVRDRARALLRRCGDRACEDAGAPIPEPVDLGGLPGLGTTPKDRVLPVQGADELAELLAHLLEEADDPVALERALDGVLRLAGVRPAARAALAARAFERLSAYPGPWSGRELRADVAALTLVWLGERRAGRGYRGREVDVRFRPSIGGFTASPVRAADWSMTSLVELRLHEVARAIGHEPRRLLSLPTWSDGALDAVDLSERLGGLRDAPGLDLELAVLRVPPDQRAGVALARLSRGTDAAVRAMSLLTARAPRWRRVVGPVRRGRGDPEPMVGWADVSSAPGSTEHLVSAVLDRRDPLARAGLEADDGELAERPDQPTALWPLVLPHDPDLLAAHAHPRLHRALDRGRSGAAPLLAALGRSDRSGGAPAASAFALALAAKDPGVRLAAVDALVLRAGRGAADAGGLAEQVRLCLADGLVVGARVVDALEEVARVDRRTATFVLDVLVSLLDAVPERREAHRWVELLADLSVRLERPVRLPAALAACASGSSALARACRRVRTA